MGSIKNYRCSLYLYDEYGFEIDYNHNRKYFKSVKNYNICARCGQHKSIHRKVADKIVCSEYRKNGKSGFVFKRPKHSNKDKCYHCNQSFYRHHLGRSTEDVYHDLEEAEKRTREQLAIVKQAKELLTDGTHESLYEATALAKELGVVLEPVGEEEINDRLT